MQTHINKWGNSFGLRIPRSLAEQLSLKNGLPVDIQVQDNTTLIIKVAKKYDLKAMLDQISDDNIHHLYLDSDDQVGNEVW
jgi:antitoxin MazE